MGDVTDTKRTDWEETGLVKYIHTKTGILLPERPGQIVSVGNRIHEASWCGTRLVLRFLNGNSKPVLVVPGEDDISYVFGKGHLTRGEEIEELASRPVFTHVDENGVYGFSFGRMDVDEADEYGVLVE